MMRVLVSFEGVLVIGACLVFGDGQMLSVARAENGSDSHGDGHYGGYQRNRATSDADYGMRPGDGMWSHLPHHGRRHRGHYGHDPGRQAGASDGGWFRRPYPYHLDYYKMRYGGSYEPYFGNIYGPPAIVIPPVYGPGNFPSGFYR